LKPKNQPSNNGFSEPPANGSGRRLRNGKRKPRACRGLSSQMRKSSDSLDAPILSQGTNRARRGSRRRAAAIAFSYDYGHMFCALDDVFAKFVTAITGSG